MLTRPTRHENARGLVHQNKVSVFVFPKFLLVFAPLGFRYIDTTVVGQPDTLILEEERWGTKGSLQVCRRVRS